MDGSTLFNITQPVIVLSNNNDVNQLEAMLTSNDPNSKFSQDLNSGNLNLVAKSVIGLSANLNFLNLSCLLNFTQAAKAENETKAKIREFLIEKVIDLSISEISSIKVISAALSTVSSDPNQITRQSAVFRNNSK